MVDLLGKWCLITGAASGIGRATAWAMQAEGARLILCDIQKQKVDALAEDINLKGGEALSYSVDVALQAPMERFAEWAHSEVGAVDVLVNNAGILRTGGFDQTSFEDWHQVLDVNLWGAIHATKLFVPQMVERGGGTLVNIASASGIVGFSKLSAYSTSKFALVGFSEAVRGELAGSGVSVSTICPGFVRTEIAKSAPLTREKQEAVAELLAARGIDAERVAEAVVRAVVRGTPLVHVGRDAKMLSALARFFPARASTWLAGVAGKS